MDEKVRFIADYQRRFFSLSELCARFHMSRKTAYKWIERYEADGPSGLQDRSRRPHACPHQTPWVVAEALLEFRRRHPTWGAKKLLRILSRRHPAWEWPSRSTASELLKRHGLISGEEYGLPRIIRTDNGVPFATTALGRLSELSVWWIRLGIYPELIEPAHPEQNGRHERMHKTLKAETTRPPRGNLNAQQARFNAFRHEYNEERPHEALGQETPASAYRASLRKLPRELPQIEYPGHFEVRLVSRNSGIRWKSNWICVTQTLGGEYVGLEEVDDGLWDVYFGPIKLGRMDERKLRIEDHKGRWVRKTVSPMSPD